MDWFALETLKGAVVSFPEADQINESKSPSRIGFLVGKGIFIVDALGSSGGVAKEIRSRWEDWGED